MKNVITDPVFDNQRTEEYKLSIQVSLDGFYFSIVQPSKNRLIILNEYRTIISSEFFLERRFKEWTETENLLSRKFSEIRILYLTEKFTIIPGELYNFRKQKNVTDLLFTKTDGYTVLDNFIPEIGGNLLYCIPKELNEFLHSKFHIHKPVHPLAAVIPKIAAIAGKNENTLVLLFGKKYFFLLLFMNEMLQAANSYYFTHPNDVIYYVLAVLEQNQISPKKVTPFATGDIFTGNETLSSLNRYFSNIELLLPDIKYQAEIFKNPMQPFITLF